MILRHSSLRGGGGREGQRADVMVVGSDLPNARTRSDSSERELHAALKSNIIELEILRCVCVYLSVCVCVIRSTH